MKHNKNYTTKNRVENIEILKKLSIEIRNLDKGIKLRLFTAEENICNLEGTWKIPKIQHKGAEVSNRKDCFKNMEDIEVICI